MPTLTTTEVLNDVLQAFKKHAPALNAMGTDFRPNSLKLNQTYTAHIPTIPTVEDVSTTYNTTGNAARSLLVDVPITVNKHKSVHLYWEHFNAIKDQKNRYEEVIGLAGYALAKAVIDDLLSGVTQGNFSQSSAFATADSDVDMLIDVTTDLNGVGAHPTGRTMFVNSAVAATLDADARVASKDYAGLSQGGNGLRMWKNLRGFESIYEYADFPTNTGTAFAITGEADTEVFTATAHGLSVGDTVTLPTLTGGSGLTASATTRYFVATVPDANTFTLVVASTGAAVAFTTDITDGTAKKTENLTGFAFDRRAFTLLAGIPEDFDQQFVAGLNIPRTMGFEAVTDPDTGLSLAAVSWQDTGTGKLHWSPTIVWGKALGRQSYANAAGSKTDYAGHRLITA